MIGLLPVRVNDAWVAIYAGQVVEILGARRWVKIPDAPPRIPGVIAWQGRAIAAFDLGVLLDVGSALGSGPPRARTLIVRVGASMLAVPVDGVREVQTVPQAELRVPFVVRHASASHEVELHGQLMPVLDLVSLFAAGHEAP
ncbi:MAG: chemotaxis protein CheW [Minicystis sp.]